MSKKKSGLGKFVLGAGIGAGLALLFAPQEGSKTRKELKKKCDELIKKAKEIDVEEVKEKLSDLDKEKALDIAKTQAKKVGKKAEELVELAKEKSTPVVEKAVKEVKNATLKAAKEVVNKLESEEKPKTSKKTNKK